MGNSKRNGHCQRQNSEFFVGISPNAFRALKIEFEIVHCSLPLFYRKSSACCCFNANTKIATLIQVYFYLYQLCLEGNSCFFSYIKKITIERAYISSMAVRMYRIPFACSCLRFSGKVCEQWRSICVRPFALTAVSCDHCTFGYISKYNMYLYIHTRMWFIFAHRISTRPKQSTEGERERERERILNVCKNVVVSCT